MKPTTNLCKLALAAGLAGLLAACAPAPPSGAAAAGMMEIPYELYTLSNGLDVVLHEDHSDPIVAVATIVHVGSARETPGRTGFAHFFEHMSFNDSENVPRGANRKLIEELGGTRNGGTSSDGTIYFEVVPKDAFEKILWIDSDRLGFMINTVAEAALEREKQVVKNEKRQRVDNAPYGHTGAVLRAALYPQGHPYSWDVIGSLEDLQGATLGDVKEFYGRFYGANNVTLVIAGDIDVEETKAMVEKWFGEIRRGREVEAQPPQPVTLDAVRSLYHEDNFAKLPELRMVFPTVEQYHADSYPLQVLGRLLAGSKTAPLYEVLVEEKKLAPRVIAYHDASELAGEMVLRVRANAGVDLDDVKAAIEEGMARFEQEGFTDNELKRIQAELETSFYNRFTSVLNKAFQLGMYNEYAGDPGFLKTEAERLFAVTRDDVLGVYQRYLKGKPFVMTSFVPKGELELAVQGAEEAQVSIEEVVRSAEAEVSEGEVAVFEKTPTEADRSEPPFGETPLMKTPDVWTATLRNGIEVYGIEHSEVPLVAFELTLEGGHWLDPPDKAGVASLLADLLMEGTQTKTPAELEEAIGLLGSRISILAGSEETRFSGNTLARNFAATVALLEEILLEPRWDEAEYERLKRKLDADLKAREADPRSVARLVSQRLLYGDEHILSLPVNGTLETAERITLDDLKAYFTASFSPSVAAFHVVGDVSQAEVTEALAGLASRWEAKDVEMPEYALPEDGKGEQIFFVDVPGSKQSVLMAAKLALSAGDERHNNLGYANQRLGGGSSSRLFQLLRIQKGYTYGAYSRIGGTLETAPFTAMTSVRANVTLESLQLLREQLEGYAATFTEDDVEVTRNQTLKADSRAFESLYAKLGMLTRMSKLGLPADYPTRWQEELRGMGLEAFRGLIEDHMDESQMFYLVVGDAATQLDRIGELGYGAARKLDVYGNPVS